MKQISAIILCIILLACSSGKRINYTPDISNLKDPISTIKNTLEQQLPACAYVPVKVEVTDQSITLYLIESGLPWTPPIFSSIVPTILYYKNLGDLKLTRSTKDPVWHVEIYNKLGNDLYWVCTLEEKEAKEFIDALYYMIHMEK